MLFETAKLFVEDYLNRLMNGGQTRSDVCFGYISAMADCSIISRETEDKLLNHFNLAAIPDDKLGMR